MVLGFIRPYLALFAAPRAFRCVPAAQRQRQRHINASTVRAATNPRANESISAPAPGTAPALGNSGSVVVAGTPPAAEAAAGCGGAASACASHARHDAGMDLCTSMAR